MRAIGLFNPLNGPLFRLGTRRIRWTRLFGRVSRGRGWSPSPRRLGKF